MQVQGSPGRYSLPSVEVTRVGGEDVNGLMFREGSWVALEGVKQGRGCQRLGETLLEVSVASCVESHRASETLEGGVISSVNG